MRPAAFILGLGENGYGTLRSLAAEKIPIVGIYDSPLQSGRFSRHCKAFRLDLSLPEAQMCQMLISWRSSLADKPVLFATGDRFALLLARQREILLPHFASHWVHAENLSLIVDKGQMSRLCQEAGILCPRTHITEPGEDLAKSVRDFPFPCLIKPIRSFQIGFPHQEKNFVADSPTALLEFYNSNPGLLGLTIWQEIIEGDDDAVFQCTTLIRKSGAIGPLFVIRKIHQFPPGFGSMCFGRSEENQWVADSAVSLLRFLDYRGFASLEFKRRTRDGRYYFIEMNPRLPWYNSLFNDAGVNFPFLAYQDLSCSEQLQKAEKPKNNVYWINFQQDLHWFRAVRKVRRNNPFRWLASAAKARSFAWWSWRDPMPFVHSTFHLVSRIFQKLMRLFGWSAIEEVESATRT
jgi:D-aspartate ligase